MLAPRHVIFTAVQDAFLDSRSWAPAADALAELERRRTPWILSTHATRAQIEPLRRKIEHGHPFITESGGGLFIPDGYFSIRLEGASRAGRYFCVPFGRPYPDATAALARIAAETGAMAVGYGQMNSREIARNTGQSFAEAEQAAQREFSERFFFAGATAPIRFAEEARRQGWDAIPGEPFWELRSGNDAGRGVRYLMRLYRAAMRTRLRSVGIGSLAEDLPLLCAVDQPIVLPRRRAEFDADLLATLPRARRASAAGPDGWNDAVLEVLE